MKRIILFLIVSILISCREEELPENFVLAKRNNIDWIGYTEMQLDDATDRLSFLGIANSPNDEVLVLNIKFEGIGSYTLSKDQVYYYTLLGGDVLTSEYRLAPNTTGELVISKYDQGLIEGSFALSLVKEGVTQVNSAETYNFTRGKFRGRLNN